VIAVCIFYSRQALAPTAQGEQACIAAANELLATALMRRFVPVEICQSCLLLPKADEGVPGAWFSHMEPSMRFILGDPMMPEPNLPKPVVSKAWQRCQEALDVPPDQRTEEHLDQITKFSKGVQFFKYITNNQRSDLCKTMTYTNLARNQVDARLPSLVSRLPSLVSRLPLSSWARQNEIR
jgi:hypothetical protein